MNDGLARAFARSAAWAFRRRLFVLSGALLLTLLAALQLTRIEFEPDVSRLLPSDHPHLRIQALLEEHARPTRTLWVLLSGEDLEAEVVAASASLRGSPFLSEVAASREELFGALVQRGHDAPLWSLPAADLDRLQEVLSPAGREAAVAALREQLADDPVAGAEVARADPLGLRWLVAESDPWRQFGLRSSGPFAILAGGDAAVLRLTGTADAWDAEFATALLADVEARLAGHDYRMFGGYAVARGDAARIRGDLTSSGIWSLVLVAAFLCWSMRGVRLPLLVQLPATLSIVIAAPLTWMLLGPLPTVTVAAVAVLCGLGVDFAIHYAACYRAERLDHAHEDAVQRTSARTGPELIIDTLATAAAFVAVAAGQLTGLRAFGVMLALGLAVAFVLTMLLLPILLAWAGDRRDPERSWLADRADRWLGHRASRTVALALVALAGVAALLAGLRGVPLNADPELLRPAGDPVAAARRDVEGRLGFATAPAALLIPRTLDPALLLDALARLQQNGWLRFWTGVAPAETEVRRARVAAFHVATAGWLDATLALMDANGLRPEPFRRALLDLQQRLAAEAPATEPTLLGEGPAAQRVVLAWPVRRLRGDDWRAFTAAVRAEAGPAVSVYGAPVAIDELAGVLRSDLWRAAVWTAAIAFAAVALHARSARLGLLAMLPAAVGLSFTLAWLSLSSEPLSMISFVAVPFVLGIGIDEGVHLVGHFRRGGRVTGATGVGVVRTSVSTLLGFAALWFVESPGLVGLGRVVCVGVATSMLAALFVLAPLLARMRWRALDVSAPAVHR